MEPEPTITLGRKESSFKTFAKGFISNVLSFGLALVIVFLIHTFVGRPFLVNGQSMDPTIKDNDFILVDTFTYHRRSPERGEVIVFRAPLTEKKFFIKRVIGLPGETVQVLPNGKVTIYNTENPEGFELDDSYITHKSAITDRRTLPDDTYYTMGDNRADSYDSRMWGVLPKENVIGRAYLRVYPFSSFEHLPAHVTYDN